MTTRLKPVVSRGRRKAYLIKKRYNAAPMKPVASAVLLLACLISTPAMQHKTRTVSASSWGGSHININIQENAATIEYDCASGTIRGPFVVDNAGRFSLRGTHTTMRGGPTRVGETGNQHPAVYTGTVKGNSMTLTVKLTDSNTTVGSFRLTKGKTGRLFKCL